MPGVPTGQHGSHHPSQASSHSTAGSGRDESANRCRKSWHCARPSAALLPKVNPVPPNLVVTPERVATWA